MKNLKFTLPIALGLAFSLAVPVIADDKPVAHNKYTAILVASTSAELPAKAAELVSQANPKTMQQTTVEVVRAALGLNPAAAPIIVGCIAQNNPAMAATAAATAASLIPHMAAAISRAAAAVAPKQAASIVEAVCRVVPAAYPNVAATVADVAPGAGKSIMTAIAVAIPDLKQYVDQTLAGYNGANMPSVPIMVGSVVGASQLAGPASVPPSGPVLGGTPLSAPSIPSAPSVPIPSGPTLLGFGGGGGTVPINTNTSPNDPTNGYNEQGVTP